MKGFIIAVNDLIGSNILKNLSDDTNCSKINTISQSEPKEKSNKTAAKVEVDTKKWAELVTAIEKEEALKESSTFFLSLDSFTSDASLVWKQCSVDYNSLSACANASKAAGAKIFVLITSSRANSRSVVPYFKNKGELEDVVKNADFDQAFILKPGYILTSVNCIADPITQLTSLPVKILNKINLNFGIYPIYSKDLARIAIDLANNSGINNKPEKPLETNSGDNGGEGQANGEGGASGGDGETNDPAKPAPNADNDGTDVRPKGTVRIIGPEELFELAKKLN